MAIIFLKQELEYLKNLLKKNPDEWWVHKSLDEKINDEILGLDKTSACEYKNVSEWESNKTKCEDCNATLFISYKRK